MNNEQQLIDEVYRYYLMEDAKILPNMSKEKMTELGYGLSQEEFINKCKTDPEFSEKWGLKIEERELSLEERNKWSWDNWGITCEMESVLDEQEVPTKLITITRELSEEAIWDYIHKNKIEILHEHAVLYGHAVGSEYRKSFIPTLIVHYNIPTKETIESYE